MTTKFEAKHENEKKKILQEKLFSFWTVIFVVIGEEETFLIKSKMDENDNLMLSEESKIFLT